MTNSQPSSQARPANADEDSLPSYWLLADDQLPLGSDPAQISALVAYFKHSLLFHRRLLLSDSQIIHNANLRRAIRGTFHNDDTFGPDFRDLFTKDTMTIAVRAPTPGAGSRPLAEVQKGFVADGTLILHSREYGYSSELDYVEASSRIVPYAISDITQTFTESVLRVLDSEIARQRLGDEIAARILLLAEEKRAQDGKLGRYFFHYDLAQILKEAEWNAHGSTIRDLVSAPYIGALPLLVGANPVYAEDHKASFEILRGTITVPEWESPVVFQGRLGLVEYVRGLNALTAEQIHSLRASDACSGMHAAIARLDGSHVAKQCLFDAIRDYQLTIEDVIVRCVGISGNGGDPKRKIVPFVAMSRANNFASLGGSIVGFLYSSMMQNILGLILSTVPFALEFLTNRQQLQLARKKEQVREELSNADPELPPVRTRTVFDSPTRNETFYFDVRSQPR